MDPLPKLILRAPNDRPAHTNPSALTKVGFQYIIAHKKASGFYWNKSPVGAHTPDNQYPIDSQVISHVPSVKRAKKLRMPGTGKIARPQENSPEEVSVRGDDVNCGCDCNYRLHRTLVVADEFASYDIFSLIDVNTYNHSQSLELVRQYGPPGGIMVDCYHGTMPSSQAALRYVRFEIRRRCIPVVASPLSVTVGPSFV